jgi:hypothetical protein
MIRNHLVVLVVEVDDDSGVPSPLKWDWSDLIGQTTTALVSAEVLRDPDVEQVSTMGQAARKFVDDVFEAGLGPAGEAQ